ncbi:MAG: XRE family transcriptional regulator [Syntrophomonas sp.]
MTLVERIQGLCGSVNTTLIGLEREIGLGRGTIRNWDKSAPSIDKIQKVADYFGVSTDYVLGKSPFKSASETKYSIVVAAMKMILTNESFKILGYDELLWNTATDIAELLYEDNAQQFVKTLRMRKEITDIEYYQLSKLATQTINWPDNFNGPTIISLQGEKIECQIDYWSIPKIHFFKYYFDEPGSEFNTVVKEPSMSYMEGCSASKPIELESEYLRRIPLVGRVAAGNPILAIENPGEYIVVDIRINNVNGNELSEYFALEITGQSMEPTIHDGEIVLVKRQPVIEPGEIGVFRCNHDEATIKRFAHEGGKVYLIPDNKQFPVQEYTQDCVCIGRVLESIRRNLK